MEWLNMFLPFGESKLGKQHKRDMEVELANLSLKDGWEHAELVLYNVNLLSIIE